MLKFVVDSIYGHKSNIIELFSILTDLQRQQVNKAIEYLSGNNATFDVIKVNQRNGKISLIQSDTWDILHEPIIDRSYTFTFDGLKIINIRKQNCGTKVYHNKWSFVSSDYEGFNVEKEKERTLLWNRIPNIKSMKSRIGNKDFWYSLLDEYGIER